MWLNINIVQGLTNKERKQLIELIKVYEFHKANNEQKEKYYEGDVTLSDVNLGIALPKNIRNLKVGCSWGAKTVDVLASRSMFDGFVSSNGESLTELNEIIENNDLLSQYMTACRDELKFGCAFATLSADEKGKCKIRFHSPQTASALWNGEKGRIDCGIAIIDTIKDESQENVYKPSLVNLYTDDAVIEIERKGIIWMATRHPHIMGRPLMLPMKWDSTSSKPFGRSRIKKPIRSLIDGYIRTIANATIGLEFNTTPQKYFLGLTDEQFDAVTSDKFKQYIGSIIAGTTNPETGEKPTFGQLQQGNLSPHVEMIRILATQFSAATGLSVTDTGVVNDANPTSSDAILAQTQTLVSLAEQLNKSNGETLKTIARMALAINRNVAMSELSNDEMDVIAHFKNPAMPSVSVTADAAIKIASSRQSFADTDTFLEMIGFDQADIRRIKAQERRLRGRQVLLEVEQENENITE